MTTMTDTHGLSDLTLLSAIGESSRQHSLLACNDTSNILQGQAASNLSACHDTSSILQGQAANTIAGMATAERLNIAVEDNVDKQALGLREAIERNGLANMNATERTATANALAIERNGANGIQATDRNASAIGVSIVRESGVLATDQQRIAGETRHILATNNTAAALLGRDIQTDIYKETCKLGLQAAENFGKLDKQVLEVKCALEFQAAQNTAAIQLESLRNKCDLSAELAKCCCELQQIVSSSAAKTQTVVQDIENNRVRDALAAATTENLLARMRAPA